MLHHKAPHDMFEFAPRYADYLKDTEIPEPDNLYNQPAAGFGSVATRGENDSLVHRIGTSVSKRHPVRNYGIDFNISPGLEDHEYTHQAYQEYLKRYLRCVKSVDDNLARLFDYLKKNGLLDNTIIIYTSDQGMMLGEHDYIDKRWMYDESMRMPFIMRYPPLIKAGSVNTDLINNTDFAPTMLALAGAKAPHADARPQLRRCAGGQAAHQLAHRHLLPLLDAPHASRQSRRTSASAPPTTSSSSTTASPRMKPATASSPCRGRKASPTRSSRRPPAWEFYDLRTDPAGDAQRICEPQIRRHDQRTESGVQAPARGTARN